MAIAPTGTDVEFMNAYIQKLSQANYQLTQKIYILETQLELASQKLKQLDNSQISRDGFGGASVSEN